MFHLPRFLHSANHIKISLPRTGIVFIPGIMVSCLIWNRSTLSRWDTDSIRVMLGWFRASASEKAQALDLGESAKVMETGPDLAPDEVKQGWASVVDEP